MYVLACCNNKGECIGFLANDTEIETNPDEHMDRLMKFNKKKDTNEICMQINMSHALLPNGLSYPFRTVPVKM